MTEAHAKFYSQWIMLKGLPVLDESHLDCDSCTITSRRDTGVSTSPVNFSIDTKCCTYFPFLPNFTLGALLTSASPSMRTRLSVAFRMGRTTPLGLFASQSRVNRVAELGGDKFGRANELICPFFDSAARTCSIWDKRPGVCSSYYCDSSMDRSVEFGQIKIWSEIERYVNQFEWTLAHESLWRLGFTQDDVTVMEAARNSDKIDLKSAWYEWVGREEEFYILSYQKALEVSPKEIEYLLGEQSRLPIQAGSC